MKHVFEIVSGETNGATRSKKLTVKQEDGLALEVVQRDIKTERGYYDVRIKFDKEGKFVGVKFNWSRGLV